MSALHPTRRSLLSGIATGLAGAFAGCAGGSTSSTTDENEVHGPFAGPPSDATLEFDARSLRAATTEPFVSVVDQVDATDQTDAADHTDVKTRRPRGRRLIHNAEQATALQFEVDHEGVQSARSFVESTDYDEASVIVYQRPIEACYERHVEYVTVEPDRYFIQFCRTLRDATTRCEADVTEMDAQFIRIPRAYETPPSSRGSGERSGCRGGRRAEADNR